MKKRIIMIVVIAMIVCIAAIACLACGTKEVKIDDLDGKTFKFFSVTNHTYFYGYDWLHTYVCGDLDSNKNTFDEDSLIVKFNKDGKSGTATYNYKDKTEEYTFTYEKDDSDEIKVTIAELDYTLNAKLSKDIMILESDGFFDTKTSVTYLRLA